MSGSLKTIYAPAPSTTRGKAVALSADAKGNNLLYCTGNAVVIRNIKVPTTTDIYYEHAAQTTVAKYAPSGFYIASGDVSGTLRIWDTTQIEHILKIELKVLSGAIWDLAWSPDSQRIVVVGDGKERFGAVMIWDAGTSVGEISFHSKPILTTDFRPVRPFRVVTGSEDLQANWFEGPPFKFVKAFKEHTRFVNSVRFSPDGLKLLTAGADKKGFLYDGKTGDKTGALAEGGDAHGLGIYGVSWSPDSKQVLTVSADKTAKIWDANGQLQKTFTFEGGVESQLLGCVWSGENVIVVNLNGDLIYLDQANPNKPSRVVKGHNKIVTALAYDPHGSHIFSGSYDGLILKWDLQSGIAVPVAGQGHTNSITQAVVQGKNLVTISMDDTLRLTPLDSLQYSAQATKLDSQPQSVAVSHQGDLIVVVTLNTIVIAHGEKVAASHPTKYQPVTVAISVDNKEIAVGGKDNSIHIYSLSGDQIKEEAVLNKHRGFITALAYSPDGKYLASADQERDIIVWDKATRQVKIEGWVYHTARVTSIAWNPNSKLIASGSLDSHVYVANLDSPIKQIALKVAHRGGVNSVLWVDENTVASTGLDCSIKTWTIKA